MTYLQAVDLEHHRVLLDSGGVLPITSMYDSDGVQTQAPEDVVAFICLGGDLNIIFPMAIFPWPTVH